MLLVTSIDVSTTNIELHRKGKNIDESEDVRFVVDDGNVVQSSIEDCRN